MIIRSFFGKSLWWLLVGLPFAAQAQPSASRYDPLANEAVFIEAEKYYVLGDYDKALERLRKVVKSEPSNGAVYYKIAEVLLKTDNDDNLSQAAARIEKALSLDKRNRQFYLLAFSIYTRSGAFMRAAQTLERLMKEVENTDEYLYVLGDAYRKAGKPNKAIKAYDRAEIQLGINEKSSRAKQKIYLQQGDTKKAIAEAEKLASAFSNEEAYAVQLAGLRAQYRQPHRAIEGLAHFIEKHPDARDAKLFLVELYRRAERRDEERALVRRLASDETIPLDNKVALASWYTEQLPPSSATPPARQVAFLSDLVERLKERYPQYPSVYLVAGDLYLKLDRLVAAHKDYLTAINKGSTRFSAWQNMLYLEATMGQIDSLIKHSEEGFLLFPNQSMCYYFNGYGYLQKKNPRKAIRALEQAKRLAVSAGPARAEICERLGDAYDQDKKYEKAYKAYDEALTLRPDNALLLNNYSYSLALRRHALSKAERMASEALRLEPDNPAYVDTYAWTLFTQGKYKKAAKVMQPIIEQDPLDPIFFDHYGDILFRLGDEKGAVKQWKKARSKGMNSKRIEDKIRLRKPD